MSEVENTIIYVIVGVIVCLLILLIFWWLHKRFFKKKINTPRGCQGLYDSIRKAQNDQKDFVIGAAVREQLKNCREKYTIH